MTTDRIRCPYCDRLFDIEQLEMAEIFRERVGLAARLGSAWHLVNEYVSCFAQSSEGRIALKKRVRLIKEMIRLWENCTFEIDGKRYRTTHQDIMQAITTVCNMDKYGFKNHNYLKRVLCDSALRISAEGMSAKEEAEREESRRRQASLFRKDDEDPVERPLSAEEFKRLRGVTSLVDQIGALPDEMKSAENTEASGHEG